MPEQSVETRSSPSVHSDPDPADEDCIPRRRGSRDSRTRPALQTARLPSYTQFLSSRTFTPEMKNESKWGFFRAHSDSPSVRAASEGTSNNEDWKTALNGSPQDMHSDTSASDIRAPQDEHARTVAATVHDHSEREASSARISEELESPIEETKATSDATAQSRLENDALKTPQARGKVSSDPSRVHNGTAEFQSELELLKKRIDELEASPRPFSDSPGSLSRGTRLHDRLRPHTDEGVLNNGGQLHRHSKLEDAARGNTHPLLRASMSSLRQSNLHPDLIRPLDMAISDALALSSLSSDAISRGDDDDDARGMQMTDAPGAGRIRAKTYERSHSRAQSVGSSLSIGRSRSSRRSLAEILHSGRERRSDRATESLAEASESSYDSHNRQFRSPHGTVSEYGGRRSRDIGRMSTSRSSLAMNGHSREDSHKTSSVNDFRGHRLSPSSRRDLSSSQSSYGEGRQRTSDAAIMDILNRSPITRESLYAKYQRDSPAK